MKHCKILLLEHVREVRPALGLGLRWKVSGFYRAAGFGEA